MLPLFFYHLATLSFRVIYWVRGHAKHLTQPRRNSFYHKENLTIPLSLLYRPLVQYRRSACNGNIGVPQPMLLPPLESYQ